jgi:hypothetical protein
MQGSATLTATAAIVAGSILASLHGGADIPNPGYCCGSLARTQVTMCVRSWQIPAVSGPLANFARPTICAPIWPPQSTPRERTDLRRLVRRVGSPACRQPIFEQIRLSLAGPESDHEPFSSRIKSTYWLPVPSGAWRLLAVIGHAGCIPGDVGDEKFVVAPLIVHPATPNEVLPPMSGVRAPTSSIQRRHLVAALVGCLQG